MSVNFSLEGKIAFVTGASYGIGFAIASGMAKAGAKIVFNDIKQELVDKGLAAYKEAGIDAHGYVCDVTNEDQVNEMVAKIAKEVAPIDILVNNAGIIKRIPMCDMTAAEFRQVIDVDLNAPFIVSKAVIPSMIERGHGKIINICSMMSELGRETVSAYAAAKGGLKMLTRNICSLDELGTGQAPNAPTAIAERIATMACKSAVKGNNRLSLAEMQELLEQLLTLDNPYHCPHGRPTMIVMTKQELERKFKRIV